MNHSISKHKQLYSLLQKQKLMNQRHDLVFSFSNNRTDNSAELTNTEIEKLISHLNNIDHPSKATSDFVQGEKMRKRILSLCHQYGWTEYSHKKKSNVVDLVMLNNWMLKYSFLHKPLNEYSQQELPALITQFETVIKKYLKTL